MQLKVLGAKSALAPERERQRRRESSLIKREKRRADRRAMFGMIKNSLFGNTEKTEYKLLSSETKVRDV